MRDCDCVEKKTASLVPLARNRLDQETISLSPFYESKDFKKKKNLNSCRVELDGAPFSLYVSAENAALGRQQISLCLPAEIDYLLAKFHT